MLSPNVTRVTKRVKVEYNHSLKYLYSSLMSGPAGPVGVIKILMKILPVIMTRKFQFFAGEK